MFEELAATCEATECNRELPDEPALVFRDSAGERRAYECPCGAVTVTVAKAHA
ncbi:hypothetical protein [Halococcus saccharolyticus]|uniref:Uncharacterized protein n=1 Tax=Halococcus saccharolyticus DSM 5350 TaxID=1227455 RepID=M0MNJ0_9EURY|nr:hypothetical protein [Halococcus saccharolyticus]EMA47267.1 hypothetical protein C449_02355 [Halococcus saccharolyticus DSM 5350]